MLSETVDRNIQREGEKQNRRKLGTREEMGR